MKMSNQLKSLSLAAIFVCFACFVGHAQTTNATLSGVVEDAKGAVVPGCKVTISNEATGLRRTVTTNADGEYTVPLLPPATYTVTAEATGFKRVQFPNIVLNVNDQRALRIQLSVGDVSAQIEVRADDGVTVRTDPAVSTVVTRDVLQNMPLNGRSFSSLALLTPGVTFSAANSDGGQISVNGQRRTTNYLTVDGVSGNIGQTVASGGIAGTSSSGAVPGTSAFGTTTNLASMDAVQEFKVQTSTYTAESGRQPGAQIQVVTRSGQNDFHGSAYEYLRNDALDARNYFNQKPAPQTPLRQNDFGAVFSGPLFLPRFGEGGPFFRSGRDKTFFFFSYEGARLRLPITGVATVPSLRLRSQAAASVKPILNSFPQPSGPEILTNLACPVVVPPNPPDPACDVASNKLLSGFASYNYGFSLPSSQDATSVRIDHLVGKKHSLFFRFNESPSFADGMVGAIAKTHNISSTRTFTTGVTSVVSKDVTNEARLNLSRFEAEQVSIFNPATVTNPFDLNAAFPNPSTQLITLSFIWNGGSGFTTQFGPFSDSFQRQLNLVDNVTWIRGEHRIKFGVDYRRLSPILGFENQTRLSFGSEAGVRGATLSSAFISARQGARPHYNNISLFGQDTWQASKRLTLDFGLRWEYNPPPAVPTNQMPRVVIGISGTNVSSAALAPAGTPFYKTFSRAFAPRLGAAYRFTGLAGNEAVIRAGFGVYYDLGNGTVGSVWPFSLQKSLSGSCLNFPLTSACAEPLQVSTTTTTLPALADGLKLPYTLQWSIGFEQGIGKRQVISATYVGAAGRNLLTNLILNGQPIDPVSGNVLPRPNPNLGFINFTGNGATSDYNSLQLQYTARLSQGLQALVGYTWAHAIDTASSDVTSVGLTRGNADFDIRHNLSGSIHYDLPPVRDLPILNQILSNWSIDTIFHAQSGRPVEAIAGSSIVDGASINIRPDYISGQPLYLKDPTVPGGRRFNVAAFRSPAVCLPVGSPTCTSVFLRQGNFGRNVLREPRFYQVDLDLARTFRFGEKLRLLVKGEAFNVLNHPTFAQYGLGTSFPSTFGIPTRTLNNVLGGLNSLYQLGGPRSIQLSARISF